MSKLEWLFVVYGALEMLATYLAAKLPPGRAQHWCAVFGKWAPKVEAVVEEKLQ